MSEAWFRAYLEALEAGNEEFEEALRLAQERTPLAEAPPPLAEASAWLSEREVREAYLRGEIDVDALEAGVAQLLEQGRMPAFSE